MLYAYITMRGQQNIKKKGIRPVVLHVTDSKL